MAKHSTPDQELLTNPSATDRRGGSVGPDRLSIYPGNMPLGPQPPEPAPPSQNPLPPLRNRKTVHRKVSPFSIMIMLIVAAVGIVLYISNIIAVNQLLNDVNALETEHRQILMEQEILRAQINRLASLERIQEKAEELGLKSLREPPVWLNVDPERIRGIEAELAKKP
ncbi:MAG: FtsL-like putative cell division protein [Bacteroidota bacterium]